MKTRLKATRSGAEDRESGACASPKINVTAATSSQAAWNPLQRDSAELESVEEDGSKQARRHEPIARRVGEIGQARELIAKREKLPCGSQRA